MLDVKKDFPIFNTKINEKNLVYLDNAATTQKPKIVLNAIKKYNESINANPHRGSHYLSVQATNAYENGRQKVQKFINAKSEKEIIFTKNTTESLNLISYTYGNSFINEGDEIVVSIMEHHSNILPWQRLSKEKKANLKYMYLDESGMISTNEIKNKITNKTKIVSITYISNVLGIINPIKEIIEYAHKMGAIVIIDAAQSIPNMKIDVQKLGVDFLVFSGHKMLGPMGIGVLYGKKELLEKMPPFLMGGSMIEYVYEDKATFNELPYKFEAGTPNVEGVIGLSSAIDYLNNVGMDNIFNHERSLMNYAIEKMMVIPYVDILGLKSYENKNGVISFNIRDIHSHDVGSILDNYGIAVRSGHHCAQPLMKYLKCNSSVRASFYLYNSKDDVDALIEGIKDVRKWLGYGS